MDFPIRFTKMSGTGNDFIIIDHREPFIDQARQPAFAKAVCQRKFSAGADGLILIENSEQADFEWRFYNADGSNAEMCGNGARCAARFAHVNNIAPRKMHFLTRAGIIEAQIVDGSVKIKLTPPENIELGYSLQLDRGNTTMHSVNTGVPHAIYFVDDIAAAPVVDMGRQIRFHERYQPAGTNANFVQVLSESRLHVRTYERGVENETLACGTGATAAAIIAALLGYVSPPVTVVTSGGEELIIHFTVDNSAEPAINDVHLEGPANFIYEGSLNAEAIRSMQK